MIHPNQELCEEVRLESKATDLAQVSKEIFKCLDLTDLNPLFSLQKLRPFVNKVNDMVQHYPNCPSVAAICLFPNHIAQAKLLLTDPQVKLAAVSAAFPYSQSFGEVKRLETEMAIEAGADEIDIVLNLSSFLDGDIQKTADEIKLLKSVCEGKHLKVILETGLLKDASLIEEASFVAMESGADFIKTSTGKEGSMADLLSSSIMLGAIRKFGIQSGKKVGFKAAGGIRKAIQACEYYLLVDHLLDSSYLNPSFFRIGASSLANNLLQQIYPSKNGCNYF